ncbi:MAG: TRAP transporter large permease subunit [Candidatus Bipolaricaulis sp.]|nr:TRAP transporter large permease subunit [Candidatus Bipolaricaulis sp.]
MSTFFPEAWILVAMVGTFLLTVFLFRQPVAVSLAAGAVVGAIVAGQGFPLRHFVEGTFVYLDTILIISCAMLFMRGIQASGLLETVAHYLVLAFRNWPTVLLVVMTVFAMSAGMVTGSSTAAVLTTGAIAAQVFASMGLNKARVGALIAMAGLLGMIAPPVSIPVMIIGGGVDMPYEGFNLPLLLLTVPTAILCSLWIGWKGIRRVGDASQLPPSVHREYGWRLYLPLLVFAGLVIAENSFPTVFPSLGLPIAFLAAYAICPLCGRRFNLLRTARQAVHDALPILGILVGVGMFIQIMTLTGARGMIVEGFAGLPRSLFYGSIVVSMPLFGAVSAFGSASILGVPFLLNLLGSGVIVTASSLALFASLGDLVPPTALAGLFAAQVVGENNYLRILARCGMPALFVMAVASASLIGAPTLERLLFQSSGVSRGLFLGGVVAGLAALVLGLEWAKRRVVQKEST